MLWVQWYYFHVSYVPYPWHYLFNIKKDDSINWVETKKKQKETREKREDPRVKNNEKTLVHQNSNRKKLLCIRIQIEKYRPAANTPVPAIAIAVVVKLQINFNNPQHFVLFQSRERERQREIVYTLRSIVVSCTFYN